MSDPICTHCERPESEHDADDYNSHGDCVVTPEMARGAAVYDGIRPLRDMVLVEFETVKTTEYVPTSSKLLGGQIEVVRLQQPAANVGVVRAYGPEVLDARAGARCVISRLQGIELPNARVLLPESAILAYLDAPEAA